MLRAACSAARRNSRSWPSGPASSRVSLERSRSGTESSSGVNAARHEVETGGRNGSLAKVTRLSLLAGLPWQPPPTRPRSAPLVAPARPRRAARPRAVRFHPEVPLSVGIPRTSYPGVSADGPRADRFWRDHRAAASGSDASLVELAHRLRLREPCGSLSPSPRVAGIHTRPTADRSAARNRVVVLLGQALGFAGHGLGGCVVRGRGRRARLPDGCLRALTDGGRIPTRG